MIRLPANLRHPIKLIALLFFPLISVAAEQEPRPTALLLYGSGGAASWEHSFNESLRDKLSTDLGQYFTPEFLPLILADPEDEELIADSLALKYQNTQINLIVAVLSEANTFVSKFSEVFAPDAAILRVLPGDEYLISSGGNANSVILASALPNAISKTAELLPNFFPDLERIYLIGGAGEGDRVFMNRYQNILAQLNLPWEFYPLSGLPPDELIQELRNSPANSAVMTTTYDIDSNGRPLRSLLITEQMAAELDLPIIALADPQIPAGAIGGNVTTVDAYARTAAQLIESMLAGEFPESPITAETDYLFNGEQLDRFNINRAFLPADSRVINNPSSVWRDHYQLILIAAAIIISQGIMIVLLLESRRRRKYAEAALSRANKMEVMGIIAGGIAHEFNNVLMSIMANAELLSLKVAQDEESNNRVGRILAASDKAKNLVTQIQLFSRQSVQSAKQQINVKEFVETSIAQMRALLPDSTTVRIHSANSPASIQGDASLLYQAILNICVNAQQAMHGKGVIEIEIGTQNLSQDKPAIRQTMPAGEYVLIAISDSGTGITEQNFEQLFEPFFTTKPHGEGSGLGLALVYQIIKNHQGFITLESQVNSGTTLTLYFPMLTESEDPVRPQKAQALTGNNERILLVDDDKMVLDANEKILENLGYDVTSFSSSVTALKTFIEQPDKFDLVFTDLSMPEMDGISLISNIRQQRPEIPVILCTGFMHTLSAEARKNLNILSKPTTAMEISKAIRSELEKTDSKRS